MEYVRMIRAHKHVRWDVHLEPEDLPFLAQQIYMSKWYPMASYERMGLAILSEVARGDLWLVQTWGRATVDVLYRLQPELFVKGDPRETFMRFHVLRETLFDFPAARTTVIRDGCAQIELSYSMSTKAEEAACHQSLGFCERLLEVSGAEVADVELRFGRWVGEPSLIEARWSLRAEPTGIAPYRPLLTSGTGRASQ